MKKKKLNIGLIISIIFVLFSLYFINSVYKFSRIEDLIRYLVIIFVLLIDFLVLFHFFSKKKNEKRKKKKKKKLTIAALIVGSLIYLFLGFNLNKIYSYFSGLNKSVTYSTSLVTLKENKTSNTKDIVNQKIGIISDTESKDGYVLAQDIINEHNLLDKNTLVKYNGYHELIMALYDNEVQYIFLPSDYENIFSTNDGFEDIAQKIKVITFTNKEETKEEAHLLGSSKDIKEPFTILLMGIDSTTGNIKHSDSFNGDSLIVVTFNPSTMNATMLSIPRDSYVPISCFTGKYENKITHSAARGTSCVINTIQDFLGIKIDYYMKINFTGVVDLVDTLGGIEVDVPYSFCEQNSKRQFGNNMIYVKKGFQTLNGEQALAFSRNRKKNTAFCSSEWTQGVRDDFVRSENQQTVIQAIIDKVKKFDDVSKIEDLLKVISNNIDTNMTEETIFSFYNIAKDMILSSSSDNLFNIQKLFIDGEGQTIYDENTRLQLWNYIPSKKSVAAVTEAMKINLELKEHNVIKTFEFSIDEDYESKTIGKGYSTTLYDLLVDLTKMDIDKANTWATKHNIKFDIEYVESNKYKEGTIISQEYPVNKRLDKISNRTIKIKVAKKKEIVVTPTKVDCLEDEDNSLCILPDFTSKEKKEISIWANSFSNIVNIHYDYQESDLEPGTVISQSVKKGTTVKEILDKNTTIDFVIAKEKKIVTPEETPSEEEDRPKEDKPEEDETSFEEVKNK